MIEPKRFFRDLSSAHKPYEGTIKGNCFAVSRIIDYRNSFKPLIHGEIQAEIDGCSLHITMSPHPSVLIFMMVWFSGVLFGLVGFIVTLFAPRMHTQNPPVLILIPLGMLVFGYGLSVGRFKFEAVKSVAFFRRLFQN